MRSVIHNLTRFLLSSTAFVAQAQSVTITVNDPRPVNAAVEQVEKLSGIPISYEDVRYGNPGDTVDVTNSVRNPAQGPAPPGFQVLIPRGGQLSVGIAVDPATQRLPDALTTANALNSVLAAAAASPVVPGKFNFDTYNGVFFVAPSQSRSAGGSFAPTTAVLSAPVNLPGQQQTALATLEAILQQVSQKTGLKIGLGTMPFGAFARSKVSIAASADPASHVLARLFAAVSIAGSVGPPEAVAGMSYHALFDPKFKTYALNIHVVPNPKVQDPSQTGHIPPVKSDAGRFVKK